MRARAKVCDCGSSIGSNSGRGMCKGCYTRHIRRETAYGRWEPRVTTDATRAHLEQLFEIGLRQTQIARLSGLSKATVATAADLETERISAETEAAILAVPVPEHVSEVAADEARVPILGARRRIQALVADGHSQRELADEIGLSPVGTGIGNLVGRTTNSDGQVRGSTSAVIDRRVRETFERLQMQPGTSERARRMGQRNGWPLPLEWDEDAIDHPDAEPVSARRTPGSSRRALVEERDEQVLTLAETHSIAEVAALVGITTRSVVRIKARHRPPEHKEVISEQHVPAMELTEQEY